MKHITLKSLIYTFFCISILNSCQNEAIEIQEQIKITISPSKVLKSFIPYKNRDIEMKVDKDFGTARLRITTLVYDSEGKLYAHNEGLLNDYNSDYSFNILIDPNEDYKLLAFSSSIMGSLENATLEAYKFEGINNLNTLKVTQTTELSFYSNFSILGILDENLNADTRGTKFYLSPATALVNLNWESIHAPHDLTTDSIYGNYTASAVDVENNSYTWTITLESGEGYNEVTINNFSPLLCSLGLTSDQGTNIYKGHISGNTLTIPSGQDTGAVDSDIYNIYLMGVNPDTYETEDIILRIDDENGSLTLENMFCTVSEKDDATIYELFEPGLKFTGSLEYDDYRIIYHNNDVVKYENNEFIYTSTLDNLSNNGNGITPYEYPESDDIYSVINLLPGTFDVFARTFIGNELTDYDRQSVSIEAGQQYVFKFDCANLKFEVSYGQLKSTICSFGEYGMYYNIRRKIFSGNCYDNGKLNIKRLDF